MEGFSNCSGLLGSLSSSAQHSQSSSSNSMISQPPQTTQSLFKQSAGPTDSGFCSTVTSGAPSIIEKNDDDQKFDYWDDTNYFMDLDSMFPVQTTPPPNQTQTGSQLQGPLQSMQLMPIAEPMDTSREISEDIILTLIDLLKDDDPVVLDKASNMVLQVSKEKGSRDGISNSPGMMVALLEAMAKAKDIQVIENGVGVLYNLSEYRQGRLAIYKFGGIAELAKLLSFTHESVVYHAITAIHNLLLHQEGSKEAVRSTQGLQKMVALLSNTNEKFLSIVADCLHLLAYGHPETKLVIQRLGGTLELLRILKTYNYPHLLWTTCRALKVLSVCTVNKRTIVENGGMQAFAMHLNNNVDPLIFNFLWTIRNLSDAAVNQDSLHILLTKLVEILRCTLDDDLSKHVDTITCVAGILSNLTCHNQTNKQIVRQLGGVEILIETIVKLHTNEEITEPAVCALRHLTCRYPEAEFAQHAVRTCQGLVPIINLLNSPSWPLKKAVVGLLRNLALCEANIVPLREHFAIQKLSEVLMEASGCMNQTNDITSGVTPMTTPFITDPKIEAIIEEAVATLHLMAKDVYNREIIRESLSFPSSFLSDLACDLQFASI